MSRFIHLVINVEKRKENRFLLLFNSLGLSQEIPENLMNLATDMIGCRPAYVIAYISSYFYSNN